MSSCSAILLAGGQSSRMGTDKALLPVGSQTLLEHMQALLMQSGIDDVIVSRNDAQCGHVADIYPGKGPLSGIHAGLIACRYHRVLVVPVDMPLLTPAMLQTLLESEPGSLRFTESELPCVIEKSARLSSYLQHQLRASNGQLSVRAMLEFVDVCAVDCAGHAHQLSNTNTPDQWKRYEQAN